MKDFPSVKEPDFIGNCIYNPKSIPPKGKQLFINELHERIYNDLCEEILKRESVLSCNLNERLHSLFEFAYGNFGYSPVANSEVRSIERILKKIQEKGYIIKDVVILKQGISHAHKYMYYRYTKRMPPMHSCIEIQLQNKAITFSFPDLHCVEVLYYIDLKRTNLKEEAFTMWDWLLMGEYTINDYLSFYNFEFTQKNVIQNVEIGYEATRKSWSEITKIKERIRTNTKILHFDNDKQTQIPFLDKLDEFHTY